MITHPVERNQGFRSKVIIDPGDRNGLTCGLATRGRQFLTEGRPVPFAEQRRKEMSAEQTVDASDPRSFATAVCQRAAAAGDCQDRVKWCFIAGLGRFSGGVAPGIIDDGATASKAG